MVPQKKEKKKKKHPNDQSGRQRAKKTHLLK